MGFRNVKRLIPHIKDCFQLNHHISNINRELILDIGKVVTLNKIKINKDPVKLSSKFGDAMHVDIGYGYNTGIGGVKYTLFLVDRASRYKYIIRLHLLKKYTISVFE